MPSSFDFNWNEGEDGGFDARRADYQPPPAIVRADAPPAEPALPRPEGRGRLGRLGLLVIGVTLGMVVGLAALSWQGQAAARSDVAPLFTLVQQALADGDADIYRSLFDETQPEYGDAAAASMAQTALLADAEAPPRLTGLRISGDEAEAEIETRYQGKPYRRVETIRRRNGQWRLSLPDDSGWGETSAEEGQTITLHVHGKDADLARLLPRLETIAEGFCRRYNPPPPCQIDLTLAADADLLPFTPGGGALPPSQSLIRLPNADRRRWGTALGEDAAEADGPISLRYPSPRLVGLNGREPHPLWWLGVSEALGDVIARRALGVVTGEEEAVFTVWAALAGDVALWAERFSEVRLPAGDESAWPADPAEIGRNQLTPHLGQRQAARAFALRLHERFGEAKILAWLLSLRGQTLAAASPAIDDLTIDQLRQVGRAGSD